MVKQILSREQLEAGVRCKGNCSSCAIDTNMNISFDCENQLAQTALELMDKLEKAKVLLKAYDMCSSCIDFESPETAIICKECCTLENGSHWRFNESLLEVPNE